jgi:light-regulated signal transduction histidine kinase (bacteriophytochrome)
LADADFEVDLTNCDREPIHELGAVQPFGFLLALSSDWLVRRASANCIDHLGVAAEDLLGTPATEILSGETIHVLRNRLTMLRGADAVERVFSQKLSNTSAQCYDFALHLLGDTIILEAEKSAAAPATDPASMVRMMMARLDATDDLPAFYREGARQVRAITGFDRVMVYRFDADGSGVVVAEAVRPGIGSFMDLRYPATDIPKQARQLYLRTPFRIIADVNATPSPIVPARDEIGAPLDLSLSVLRSVSPIHIEYLQNMGVGASLSISIIVEGKLWGLFACHHYSARCPDFERRSIAELFGAMFGFKLESRERKELASYETSARATADRLLAAVAGDASLLDRPDWLGEMLGRVVPCDGIAIWIDGRVSTSGLTPPQSALPALVRRLNAMAAGRVFATDHLADVLPQAADYANVAAGLLAIPISRSPRDYVLLFRQERVRTVTWGGDPHKPATFGPNGARLSPRKSFEAWSQEVRDRSEPFREAELRTAEMLRASLIEVVLRLSDDMQEEKRRASERQELLIAELNHRVRNILSLIRGLVRQSSRSGTSVQDYVSMLEGRVEALARAHDQITQDSWNPAPIDRLIETEASAFLAGKASRVEIVGAPVLLRPGAFSTLALVFHELMTNSAKYGALSDNGRVSVRLTIDAMDDLRIEWREIGGPAVQAPTRQGFGTTIIQRSIPYDLGGKADVRYAISGLEADFCVPARHIVLEAERTWSQAESASVTARADETADEAILSGDVLLVEDSMIIAMDAEDALVALGAKRVSTAATVSTGLLEVDDGDFELAVLDVNLGAETSLPIAHALKARGIPFTFATGYGEQLQLPPELDDAPIMQKPYNAASLRRAIASLLNR